MRRSTNALNISTKSRVGLLRPSPGNCAAVYYWQPGYSVYEEIKSPKAGQVKVFKPTSTIEMAISFLTKYYGPKEFIKHKHDIHPGHVSLSVKEKYLSIGTEDDLQGLTPTSEHTIVVRHNLIKEIYSFGRIPLSVDLHTLDLDNMSVFIDEFKKSPKPYSIFGRRLKLADGESCATIVHEVLLQGGFSKLLDYIPDGLLCENVILTPASLIDYCEIARSSEQAMFPEVKAISTEFQIQFQKDMEKFRKEFGESLTKSDAASGSAPPTFKD